MEHDPVVWLVDCTLNPILFLMIFFCFRGRFPSQPWIFTMILQNHNGRCRIRTRDFCLEVWCATNELPHLYQWATTSPPQPYFIITVLKFSYRADFSCSMELAPVVWLVDCTGLILFCLDKIISSFTGRFQLRHGVCSSSLTPIDCKFKPILSCKIISFLKVPIPPAP